MSLKFPVLSAFLDICLTFAWKAIFSQNSAFNAGFRHFLAEKCVDICLVAKMPKNPLLMRVSGLFGGVSYLSLCKTQNSELLTLLYLFL